MVDVKREHFHYFVDIHKYIYSTIAEFYVIVLDV